MEVAEGGGGVVLCVCVCRGRGGWRGSVCLSVCLHLLHTFILHPEHRAELWPLSVQAGGMRTSRDGFLQAEGRRQNSPSDLC